MSDSTIEASISYCDNDEGLRDISAYGSKCMGKESNPSNYWRDILMSVLCGQFLSLLNAGTNIFISLMNQSGIFVSLFPNELVYNGILLISVLVGTIFSRNLWSFYKSHSALIPWYIAMAAADFAANVSVMMAFESSSPLSVMIITSSSAIFVMILSIIVFRRKYLMSHYASVLIVMAGIAAINYSKFLDGNSFDGTFLKGTLLALAAAVGYALSNVFQEKASLLEQGYPIATLGGMGLFGTFFSLIITQFTDYGIADRDAIILSPSMGKFWVIGYISCMILLYTLIPLYLQRYNSIRFNFSMLTADMYVFIFYSILPIRTVGLDAWYVAGFFTVIFGLFVFNLRQPIEQARSFVREH